MAKGERDINKRPITVGQEDAIHRIILKEFGRPEDDGYGPAYRRAFEELTSDYSLDEIDYKELAEDAAFRREQRLAAREGRKLVSEKTRLEQAGITEHVIKYQRKRLSRESK